MTSTRRLLAAAAVLPLAVGCALLSPQDDEEGAREVYDPALSLTAAGEELAAGAGLAGKAPRYDVRAEIQPGTGAVDGVVRASLPVGEATEVSLRYFAGLPDFDADATVGRVTVDGGAAEAERTASILTVQLPADHAARVELSVPFSYEVPETESVGLLDALTGLGGPADVGLLGRSPDALSLGHWFPIWVPPGNNVDPEPTGFGDIGNFPAALIRAELTVPEGWTVVDGGVRTGARTRDGDTTVSTHGYGMRDLVVSVVRGYTSRSMELDDLPGVTVNVWGPRSAEGELDAVLAETALAMETLSDLFVAYPWREFDVVSAPLGAGVAGMEWPGATWIEASMFAGGLPGLDGLEGLLGDDAGQLLETLRPWTIAHEVGHEWWHVLVGNDSMHDPAVDEPLAQYSACLVLRASDVPQPDALCEAHVTSAYEQMRLLGTPDGGAARETDEFDSAMQYAGVVYGKAAAFYPALEDAFGQDQVIGALREVTEQQAFTMVTTEQLRQALSDDLGEGAEFGQLWRRWMTGTYGDQDLGG